MCGAISTRVPDNAIPAGVYSLAELDILNQ